ncbi:D-lactate dehydrogenase [Natranaerovirga pectinivora]|uniref:D-lactate dehydrogenase n=1 Tax=Natranaerovirga pectinivora TaxID=682400 RepID=A0A4V2V036_9FIRM|nr:2-hydroxyacid dehydrogenase [Natranaerovirga pectinivora]TCT13812.1 D-lactate dehydrogenase [Natranaerovirga pectinivora]
MKVAFFDTKPYDQQIFEAMNKEYNLEFTFYESRLTARSVLLAKGFDVVCVFVRDEVTKIVIDQLAEYGVKMIALRCAGYNNIDFAALNNRLKVVNVPAYSPYAVAEFTVGMMLTLNRKIHKAYNRTRDMNFSLNGLLGFDMHNKTVGIIGTGKIAKVLIQILKGFGCQVIAYDIVEDEKSAASLGYQYTTLDELYKKSDIISLHCPLTKETEYLINEDTISKMKDGVMIINTGRGKLIHTIDLIEALKEKKVGSAGLDVYEEEEEYFYEDYSERVITDDVLTRLLGFPNVLITSHQAFFTKDALLNITTTTLDSINQLKNNKTLINEITLKCDTTGCSVKNTNS